MARQEGIIPLSGKLGNLIFSNRNGKRHVKAKSTKPINQTEATKKSSTDFGEASKTGARIRHAFTPFSKKYADATFVSRFTKRIMKVFKTMPSTLNGYKKLNHGDIGLFKGFQFNAKATLDSLLYQQPVIELEKGGLEIVFEENSVANLFSKVKNTNTAVLQLMVYNLNLDGADDEIVCVKDLIMPLNGKYFRGAKLQVPLNFVGEQVAWVALGIHYLKERDWMIGDQAKRAAGIIYVKRLSDGAEVVFIPHPKVPDQIVDDKDELDWELM